jgi:hypothetical protein
VARELFDMPLKRWEMLNRGFHSTFLNSENFELDPNWNKRIDNQVKDIKQLYQENVIDAGLCIDYACGDGRLKKRLEGPNRDKYICCRGYDKYTKFSTACSFLNIRYNLVINTSFFEHVRNRDYLDEVDNLVTDNGALALHTLVCEEVPKDPNWFYLVPVHSVVYTNRAMQILFDQWGYKYSLYNPDSRMWFWFKEDLEKSKVPMRFIYKDRFVDYWK